MALADPRRQRRAEHALAGCVTDENQLSLLRDATLCHGWAGLIHATWRAATDAGPDSDLATHLPRLRARLDQHLHRHGPPPHDGLLEGTAGVHLALHSTTTHDPHATRWDACLLVDA